MRYFEILPFLINSQIKYIYSKKLKCRNYMNWTSTEEKEACKTLGLHNFYLYSKGSGMVLHGYTNSFAQKKSGREKELDQNCIYACEWRDQSGSKTLSTCGARRPPLPPGGITDASASFPETCGGRPIQSSAVPNLLASFCYYIFHHLESVTCHRRGAL